MRQTNLFCILLLLSACSPAGAVQPPAETAPVRLLFPTNSLDFIPPTGAPGPALPAATLAPTQPDSANLSAPPGADSASRQPAFDAFVARVKNGRNEQVVGVYVENVLALRVVQQPPNQPDYVSTRTGDATLFLLAFTFAGNTGLLAHNYLSGKLFFNLKAGDVVQIIYGDGSVREYEINRIETYQALKPDSPTSDFVDISNGETMTATNLFYRVYGGDHHVTFQTCITQDNNSQWGRIFVIANPL